MVSMSLVNAPDEEPVTTVEAKDHLRVEHDADDTLIDTLIAAAREHVEAFTRRALITQTWDMVLDAFPPRSDIPIVPMKPPLRSVESITYKDSTGSEKTWDASKYVTDTPTGPFAPHGRILPAHGEAYPSTIDEINAVTVKFEAGYGDAEDVPEAIKRALLLLVGHLYEHRESIALGTTATEIPQGLAYLLWPYRALRL